MKPIVLGAPLANAFLQRCEIFYGVTWVLSAAGHGTEVGMSLLSLVMASHVVLVREHLRFKRTSAALLSATGTLWLA